MTPPIKNVNRAKSVLGLWTVCANMHEKAAMKVLNFSYLWLRRRYFALGNEKKNLFFFCISLVFSYLCPQRLLTY